MYGQERIPLREAVDREVIDSIPDEEENPNITNTINIPTDVKYAQDPLESEIEYDSEDSMHYHVIDNTIYLFGNAYVKYEGFELKADYIIFDQTNTTVTAEGRPDSTGVMSGFPEFKDEEQEFKAKKIVYNYKTKKGIITEVTTQQNDLYIHSGTLKYQKADNDHEGHNHVEDVIFSKNSLFTTCDHPTCPHFGIRSKKQKIIANKVIVVGPSNLEIAGVTTPLWIPFGFFPMTKGKRSGLIFPRDYENSLELGFGLRNVGYYWAFNDKVDLQLTGEIYTRGTWRVNSYFRYNNKYKYNGSLRLNYAWNYRSETPGEIGRDIDKTLLVDWIYNQDKAANPNYSFKAKVNFQINNAQQVNTNDYDNVFNNRLGSRIDFNKPMKGMNLTASIIHEQVNSNRNFKLDLPNVKFRVNRFFPFERKIKSGKEKWFEKIGVTYTADAITRINTKDTLLFTPEVFDDISYGIRQNVDLDASFRVFKHFNLTPNIDYSESWFFQTIEKNYNTTESYTVDTIRDPETQEIIELDSTLVTSSKLDTINQYGFKPLRQFRAGLSLNTEIFSTLLFKKGFLEGIRYTMRPNIGFSYTPDYTQSGWGYINTYQQGDREVNYSRFEGNVFNQTPSSNGMQMSFDYGFSSLLEAKVKTRRDSTKESKIVKIFDSMNFRGNYNFAADSLNFSTVTGSATMRLFKGVTTVTFGATFDPYIEDAEGRRINTTRWSVDKKLLRFDNLNTRFRTNISWRNFQDWFGLKPKKNDNQRPAQQQQQGGLRGGNNNNVSTNYNTSFITNVSFTHDLNIRTDDDGTEVTVNSISLRGDINLTSKWHFNISNVGYNLKTKNFVYPQVSVARDLHCWQMGMSWFPQRGVYSFYLRVNPGSLDFISVPWNKNQFDTGFGDRF